MDYLYDSPESLGKKGHYTYQERLYYHKDYNFNDMAFQHSKYVFSNIGAFLSTNTIYRRGSISELESDLDSNIGQVQMRTPANGILPLDDYIEASSNQGFLVIHKGKIIYERYDKMEDYQYHTWMSATKTLVGWIAYLLHDSGRLDLSKTIGDYLPQFKNAPCGKVEVRHVLNMSSGIFGRDEFFGAFLPYFRFKKNMLHPKFYSGFKFLPVSEKKIGTTFAYSTTNTLLMTMILEKILDQSISDFLTENLWAHIGAEHDANIGIFGISLGKGTPVSGLAGLMSSTLRDFGRYGMIYTPSWSKISKKQLVPEGFLKEIWDKTDKPESMTHYWNVYTNFDNFIENDVGFGKNDIPTYAAYHWDMIFDDGDMIKTGFKSQGLYVSYEKDLVIVWFGCGGEHPSPVEYPSSYARAIAKYLVTGNHNQYDEEYLSWLK